MIGAVERLRTEIRVDRETFSARVAELRGLSLDAADAAVSAQAAVALHHAYGAVEAAMTRTARVLDGDVPTGPDWHLALLESMGLELEGIRATVLSPASVRLLRKLLAFRHFFRHAYAVSWDLARLRELRTIAVDLEPLLLRDLDTFDAVLRALSASSS